MSEPMDILVSALAKVQDAAGSGSSFSFPRIIVVGNQSAGKSSIIEGIVGKPFLPRGSDIVTRCPLHVRLHQVVDQEEELAVFCPEEKHNLDEVKLTDFVKVREEIERRTEKRVGNTKNISNDEIQLDIYSAHYPDLQFVDLPGFTKTNVRGQDEDIEEQILRLNLPYMRDENTIILAIQDATQDIGVSEALKLALGQDVDPQGLRTVGVLTKLDNLRSDSDKKRVVQILENKTKPLKLGYIGVVMRSQDDIDKNRDISEAKKNETAIINSYDFTRVKHRLGVDYLRKFITTILAGKVKKMMPVLRQQRLEELQMVNSQLAEYGQDKEGDVDFDDLIAQLVEKSIAQIRTSLNGLHTGVKTDGVDTGANINEMIKRGATEMSRVARTTHTVDEFYNILDIAIKNAHGVRDHILPVEIVLELAVSLLTENYRTPFQQLLDKTTNFLKSELSTALETTLGMYPKAHDMVNDILLGEVEVNKDKAQEYMDMMINIHKGFVNSEHVEFKKVNKVLRNDGIRYKNNFNLWFKDNIPSQEENQEVEEAVETSSTTSSGIGSVVDLTEEVAGQGLGGSILGRGVRMVRGFVERLQHSSENSVVHTNKLPSKREDEALLHLDLCLEYMEIVDKALTDEIPKMFIMMLVHKNLAFMEGGGSYPTSLLRQVQRKCRDVENIEEVLARSHSHEQMIKELKERKKICEETIIVIDQTSDQLNKCT